MKDWKNHWDRFPANIDETSFLEQVGKTVNGNPISSEQFDTIVSSVKSGLQIRQDDTVLDLCCGNGLITKAVAGYCRSVVGMDYSRKLLDVAVKYNSDENIEYILGDAMELVQRLDGRLFNGVYMYEALQHFNTRQLQPLLRDLRRFMPERFAFYIGSIPDEGSKWAFYNTFRRKLSYAWRSLVNDEAIGTWWERDYIKRVCEENGLKVSFIAQDGRLHTSHYRFDVYIHD